MVAYLCLSYYFVPEQISNSINQLHISDDRLTASHCDQNKCSVVHFHRWFQSTSNLIASWTFKINELHKDGKLFFGFVSEEIKQMDRNFPPRFKSEEHAMYLMTESHTAFAQCDGNLVGSDNGVYLRCDDTVVITLDLQEQQIRQQALGLQEEVVFSNIKKSEGIKYKMASILCSHGDSLTLQKCEIMHRSPIKDPGAPELREEPRIHALRAMDGLHIFLVLAVGVPKRVAVLDDVHVIGVSGSAKSRNVKIDRLPAD
eukprot:CAMPEP_0197027596 /NCGR_PEP_ID=MMETSP1384-20130603/7479_1 /TAXON_ID=29189 /ORGANISM="Ammonia sp." /LENGTH=257 /DNA_ID=CAMNT_0042456461 /DNA_START=1 /DNA_END=775 /DNA_ORIENTATION=-